MVGSGPAPGDPPERTNKQTNKQTSGQVQYGLLRSKPTLMRVRNLIETQGEVLVTSGYTYYTNVGKV